MPKDVSTFIFIAITKKSGANECEFHWTTSFIYIYIETVLIEIYDLVGFLTI